MLAPRKVWRPTESHCSAHAVEEAVPLLPKQRELLLQGRMCELGAHQSRDRDHVSAFMQKLELDVEVLRRSEVRLAAAETLIASQGSFWGR